MSGKKWVSAFLILFVSTICAIALIVAFVDPFFHYGPPKSMFYYRLSDQRSQNDGITRHFDYDSIVTGTSMAENCRTSLFDELFSANAIKVTYPGATYKEINDNLKVAYESGHNVRYVFRPIDYSLLLKDKDEMRVDMGEYPVWLTNKNPFDDVKYLLNRDVLISYVLPEIAGCLRGDSPGYPSFDEYSFTGDVDDYDRELVLSVKWIFNPPEKIIEVSEEDIEMVRENIEQNVVSLAREHPETTFIYFFPPYSMAYWGAIREEGNLDRYLYLIRMAAEQMLECDNIHVYCFGFEEEVTSDLGLYRDVAHFRPEVNDLIMEKIARLELSQDEVDTDRIRITKENLDSYFEDLRDYIENFNYQSL